jgi:predicted peptidase
LKYQLLKPTYVNIEEKYPLVVCLPFGGGVEGCPPAEFLSSDANQRKYPSFLFVPYCPQGAGWGGVPNYPTIDTLVFEAITSLEKEFAEINEKKCYVTGVSRGGYGSWHFITTRPDMFAAAMPVCGEGNPTLASNIVDVGVWAFHGKKDRNVPVSGSREMIAAIKNAGGDPKYTEFPDAGHNVWELVKGTSGVLEWLFDQEKD